MHTENTGKHMDYGEETVPFISSNKEYPRVLQQHLAHSKYSVGLAILLN